MRKAFRDAYERELDILYERSAEFAEEYPGLADRLGGLLRENIDPMVAGLLEGTAFMAARVQLKLDEEFRAFTTELLEQVFPAALAPIPSCMILQAAPVPAAAAEGAIQRHPRGALVEAPFRDADKRIVCRYSLAAPLAVLPLEVAAVTYHDRPAPLVALGQDPLAATRAGLTLGLRHAGGLPLASLGTDAIDVQIVADPALAAAIYEQVHCNVLRASLRWLDAQGDPVFLRLRPEQIGQTGFDRGQGLFDAGERLFEGFSHLRDFFAFPQKIMGLRLTGLAAVLPAVKAPEAQLILELDRADDALARQLGPDHLRLNCVPAVNLFEERSNQIRLGDEHHEYPVTPDGARLTQVEVQRILEVHASFGPTHERTPVHPLYDLPPGGAAGRAALFYTFRRKPRRPTAAERRAGLRSDYRGTETFIALHEPPPAEGLPRAHRLHVRALCSNRHLPNVLPLSQSDALHLVADQRLRLNCVAGPSPPREAMTEIERDGPHRMTQGEVYWRLVSYLSLNHFGLDDRFGRNGAGGLREMLSLFADVSDSVTEAMISGITDLAVRPITRSIRRPEGFFPARGLEIAITYDEPAFEGTGIVPLAAVIDRFLAEYVAVNSFTQTLTISRQRGLIRRWPPRTGRGPLL